MAIPQQELSTLCTGVGKTSLANTLESFLKSPTKSPKSWSWLSENHPEILCTQVMQLYDGLSINNNEELAVEVGNHAQNVKLVTLRSAQAEEDTNNSQALPPTSAKPELKPEAPVDKEKAPSVPSAQGRWILPSWLTGKDKEVPIPGSPETKTSKGPDNLAVTKEGSDSDEAKDHSIDQLNDNNKTQVQVKLVDLGGHTATMLVIVVFMLSA